MLENFQVYKTYGKNKNSLTAALMKKIQFLLNASAEDWKYIRLQPLLNIKTKNKTTVRY